MQRRHHQGEEETKARAKNGVPLPPDGFSFANLFLEPLFPTVFPPPTFRLPPETEPHSFICTLFYSYVYRLGLHSVLLFAFLWLFGKQIYKSVFYLKLSAFKNDIKNLLFVLFSSAEDVKEVPLICTNPFVRKKAAALATAPCNSPFLCSVILSE